MAKARIIAVAGLKGGIGKTTLAVNLAAGLAHAGRRTILVDADPQAGATRSLAVQAEGKPGLADVLSRRVPLTEALCPVEGVPRLWVVPGDLRLARLERELSDTGRMRDVLAGVEADVVVVDTPPGWGGITVAILVAATDVLAPVEPKVLSMAALADLMEMVEDVRRRQNPQLRLMGVVPFKVQRTRLAVEGQDDLDRHFPGLVFPAVRESARVAEAPGFRKPVRHYAPESIGAEDFAALTRRVLAALR